MKLGGFLEFWEFIAIVSPRRGLAWLSNGDLDEWGRKDTDKILSTIINTYPKEYLKSMIILDYGCGMGRVAKYIAPYIGRVICADVSKTYLKVARKYLKEYNNIKYLHVNGKDLRQLPDESIDAAYSIGVFVHINKHDALKLFKEIKRSLKPGGLLIVDLPKPGTKWPSFEKYEHHDIKELINIFETFGVKQESTVLWIKLRKL